MCNFNLDSGVCLSSVQAGLISQEPLGQLQGGSDAGESETFKMTDSCHPVLDHPLSLLVSLLFRISTENKVHLLMNSTDHAFYYDRKNEMR